MKIFMETSLENFHVWSGAAIDTKKKIIEAGMAEEFEVLIDELYPEGISITALNDLLWFNNEWIYEQLGIEEEEEEEE